MKGEFSKVYAASFPEDASLIERRWEAINTCIEELNKSTIVVLVALAFRLRPPQGSVDIQAVRNVLTGDAVSLGEEEFHILSASALKLAMQGKDKDVAVLSASIVCSASCGGLREPRQPMNLVSISENVLSHHSENSRRRPSLEHGRFTAPLAEKGDAAFLKAIGEQNAIGAVSALLESTNKALNKMAGRQREFEAAVQKYVNIQDEELDILWWLEGGRSFDLACDFSKIEAEHLPLAVARELAGLTKVLPGPPAIISLLSRTGLLDEPLLSIPVCVQSMPLAWLNQVVDSMNADHISPALTPVLFALQRRHEVHGQDEWISAWSTITGITQDKLLSPLQLALAAYREFTWTQLG